MLHPLFSAAIQRPDLVVGHLSAYVALISEEARAASSQLLARIIAGVVAALCAAVFLTTTGVAVMLGFSLGQFHWSLVAVPACALLVMALAIFKAMNWDGTDSFSELKTQLDNDLKMLSTPASPQ